MADLTITIPEPTDTSDGLAISISRNAGSVEICVSYEQNGIRRCVTLRPADFTANQRTQLQTVAQFIVAAAKARMGF